MKRPLFFLFAGIAAILCLIHLSWADSGDKAPLSLRDELLMENTMLMLWDIGYTSPRKLDSAELCRITMKYMMFAEPELGESRDGESGNNRYFENIPDRYILFFPKKAVEDIALNIFGGWIDGNNLPNGYFCGSNGYYIDIEATAQDRYISSEDVWLPSYAEISSVHMESNGTCIINGKLRRFKMLDDSSDREEIIWVQASFMARFSPAGNGWKLDSFVITDEAMG